MPSNKLSMAVLHRQNVVGFLLPQSAARWNVGGPWHQWSPPFRSIPIPATAWECEDLIRLVLHFALGQHQIIGIGPSRYDVDNGFFVPFAASHAELCHQWPPFPLRLSGPRKL